MLERILDTIETTGTLSVAELGSRLGIEEHALAGMLEALGRAGLVDRSALDRALVCPGTCGKACSPAACVYAAGRPGASPVEPVAIGLRPRSAGGRRTAAP